MRKYTTAEKIGDYMLIDIDPTFEDKVDGWIEGVSRMLDQAANRKLVAEEAGEGEEDASLEDKYFDGNGQRFLTIDDCVEVEEVAIGDINGDNEEETEDYLTYPRIAPIRRLILKGGVFSAGVQNVRVKARWGLFADVPKDIELACTIIVAGVINASTPGKQAIKSESIGNYQVAYTDEKGIADFDRAKSIIDTYRKHDF
ncbi:MAG: hypothetical protein WC763_04725 [Candidatus Paceibacterota bacterium]|jgi:hypothetical protein